MIQKHTYIKQLYKEWNILWLEHELNEIENIINDYKVQLKDTMIPHEKEEIEKVIKNNDKLSKFIQKIKYMLIKKLK